MKCDVGEAYDLGRLLNGDARAVLPLAISSQTVARGRPPVVDHGINSVFFSSRPLQNPRPFTKPQTKQAKTIYIHAVKRACILGSLILWMPNIIGNTIGVATADFILTGQNLAPMSNYGLNGYAGNEWGLRYGYGPSPMQIQSDPGSGQAVSTGTDRSIRNSTVRPKRSYFCQVDMIMSSFSRSRRMLMPIPFPLCLREVPAVCCCL